MLIDSKKLWIEGGYGLNNPYEIMIAGVRGHARTKHISQEDLDLILVDFFIVLRNDPFAFRTENNICLQCDCDITNSGTNAIHYLFKQIDNRQIELINIEQDRFTLALDQKLINYIKEDNEKYIEEFGPKEYKWYEIPTIKKYFFGIK